MSTMTGLLAGGAALLGATLLAKRSSDIAGCGCGLAQSADGEEQEMFFGQLEAPRKRRRKKKAKKKTTRKKAKRKSTRKKAARKTKRKSKRKTKRRGMRGLEGGSCSIMRTPSGPRCYCNKKFAKMSACR